MTFGLALAVLVCLLVLGVPLPFCFGGALMYIVFAGYAGNMTGMFLWGFEQLVNPVLLCIPLFVFAGSLMAISGMAAALLEFCDLFLGRLRGSLGFVAICACAIIGAISGSGMTGVAAAGPQLIPAMTKRGYGRPYAVALIANASVLGLLIPPSINMIVYGWITGTSILACFLSTLLPGLLLALIFCLINWRHAKREGIPRSAAPFASNIKKLPSAGIAVLPALMLPLIILGGIYGGIMTPTESAAVAAFYALPAGWLFYRGLTPGRIARAAVETATGIGALMAMILFGLMLSQQFVLAGAPEDLRNFLFSFTDSKPALLFLVNLVLICVGMFVNDVTGILLMAPLLLPLMLSLGLHPVHFGAIIGVNLAMGTLTPPFAGILYFSMRIGKVEFMEIAKPMTVFLCLGYLPMCFLVTFCEPVAMWLPRLFGLV